jgi:peptidoglycan/xylan/chitin deacetylase (PgdA/CDA1 family)
VNVKALGKTLALKTGGFGLWHRARHRDCLTVLMFHRVLPQPEIERLGADPERTVTPELLRAVMAFVTRHYTAVGVEDVLASREQIRSLPPYPLLVTFDDGWRDNLDHAAPVLEAMGIPWLLFAAMEAVSQPLSWWQQTLQWAMRSGRASYEELWTAASGNGVSRGEGRSTQNLMPLLLRFGALSDERRDAILQPYALAMREVYGGNIALGATELRELRKKGVGIGAHGSSHLPLSLVDRAERDIVAAREWLATNVDVTTENAISFPNGRYDARSARAARDAGYRLLFTSDPVLNRCPHGWLSSDVIGRIAISTSCVGRDDGTLVRERLAPWLFFRERASLAF